MLQTTVRLGSPTEMRMSNVKEEKAIYEQLDAPDGSVVTPKAKPTTFKCGFVACVTKEGNFKFEIYGTDVTLTELMGLSKLAEAEIEKRIYENMLPDDDEVKKKLRLIAADLEVIKKQLNIE
jgi:hypothetical protein